MVHRKIQSKEINILQKFYRKQISIKIVKFLYYNVNFRIRK
jgi:hypothetical protein